MKFSIGSVVFLFIFSLQVFASSGTFEVRYLDGTNQEKVLELESYKSAVSSQRTDVKVLKKSENLERLRNSKYPVLFAHNIEDDFGWTLMSDNEISIQVHEQLGTDRSLPVVILNCQANINVFEHLVQHAKDFEADFYGNQYHKFAEFFEVEKAYFKNNFVSFLKALLEWRGYSRHIQVAMNHPEVSAERVARGFLSGPYEYEIGLFNRKVKKQGASQIELYCHTVKSIYIKNKLLSLEKLFPLCR